MQLEEFLLENLRYDKKSSNLFWKKQSNRGMYRNLTKPLGRLSTSGYKVFSFKFKKKSITLSVHRVIWFLNHGVWPVEEIDHIDNNKVNNKIDNLREVSSSENKHAREARADNQLKVKGVYFHPRDKRFYAYCKKKYLGCFKSLEEAQAAYSIASVAEFPRLYKKEL
jgi:hypothetical protein